MTSEMIQAVEVMSMEAVDGVGVTELAKRLGCSKAKAFRTLKELVDGGWAEQTRNERYILSTRFGQIAERVRKGYLAHADAITRRLSELSRDPEAQSVPA